MGIQNGVTTSKVSASKWNHGGELAGIDYVNAGNEQLTMNNEQLGENGDSSNVILSGAVGGVEGSPHDKSTVRKGSKGAAVRELQTILRKVRQIQEGQQQFCKGEWQNRYGLVFTDPVGNPCKKSTVYNHFKRICRKLGYPRIRFHDLRHTFAMVSLQNRDSIKLVSENLGHATVAFTLDVYGHVSDEMRQESATKMQEFYNRFQQDN